jgi:hypothetical protein
LAVLTFVAFLVTRLVAVARLVGAFLVTAMLHFLDQINN